MSFPIPIKYESTEELNNTRVVYNNGDTLDMIPNEDDVSEEANARAIGTLSNLTTTEKTNLVGAINEVDADVTDVKEDLGELTDLTTTDKDSLVDAVNEVDADLTETDRRVLASYPTNTASGKIASFADGADDIPVKSLVVNIEPNQSGSGDPSPTNVRAISGWTGATVTRCGKNLFDSNFSDYTKPYDYYVKPIKLESGKRYVIKAELVGTAVTGSAFGVTKKGDRYTEFTPYIVVTSSGTVHIFEFTVDDTFTSPKVVAYVSGQAKFDEVMSNYNITLEVKANQNPYEPYSGTSLNIQLGQTVYGGTLDVVSGVLTITKGYIESYNGETINEPWISSMDVYSSGATPTTGAQVVYTLSTPTTIQLTAQEVATLLADNNIYADAGTVDVVYRADPTLFIRSLTDSDEDIAEE